jgi:hypothetical protein
MLAGCQSSTSREGADGFIYDVKPAKILESKISFGESYPVEVFLHIKCEINDSMTNLDEIAVGKLKGDNSTFTVKTRRSKLAPVNPLIGSLERDISPGDGYKTGETYTVTVNDKILRFRMP